MVGQDSPIIVQGPKDAKVQVPTVNVVETEREKGSLSLKLKAALHTLDVTWTFVGFYEGYSSLFTNNSIAVAYKIFSVSYPLYPVKFTAVTSAASFALH